MSGTYVLSGSPRRSTDCSLTPGYWTRDGYRSIPSHSRSIGYPVDPHLRMGLARKIQRSIAHTNAIPPRAYLETALLALVSKTSQVPA